MSQDHVIDIIIRANDMTSGGLQKAQQSLLRFDEATQRTNRRLRELSSHAHDVTLNLIDRVTPQGGRINRMFHNLSERAYRITLNLNDGATARIRAAEARLATLTAKAYVVTMNVRDNVSAKASKLKESALASTVGVGSDMLVGAGIGYGIYDTIKTYKDFEAQMSAVGAISGATGEDMSILEAKAKEMGAATSFSATDAGKAFEYMAMAGWKTQDMVAGIEGIMDLAAASGEDLANVSDIVTDALTAFGLSASDAGHFADVLAAASSNSNTNVGMLGESFKQVAPMAGTLGYSIEDVSLALGVLANSGMKGERAGTSLLAVLNGMASPTKQAQDAMDQLGISMFDSSGKARPLRDVLDNLRESFAGLSQEEKAKYAYDLAGVDGMKAIQILVGASASDYDKLTEAIMNSNGAAKEMADTRMNNLAGDIEQLGGAWETFQLSLMGGSASNFLREFVQGATSDLEKLTKYMKDGLDISDIGKLAMDILTQLKNKFLELDGVGSLLAGGALAAGLYKIANLGLKAADALKGLSVPKTGGGLAGASGGKNVGSMVVHAQSVVVNGRVSNSGAGGGPVLPDGSGGGGRPRGGSRLGRVGKAMGRVGLPLMAAVAAYDVYSTKEGIDNDKEYAANNLSEKAQIYQSIANDPTKSPDEIAAAEADYDAAIDYKQDVDATSAHDMNTTVGSAAGGLVGTVIGGAIGSVVAPGAGTMVGGMVGGMVGSELGGALGENWESIKESAGETWEWITNGAESAITTVGEVLSGLGSYIADGLSSVGEFLDEAFLTPLENISINVINFVVGLGDMILEALSPITDPIIEMFSSMWDAITEGVSTAWDYICGIFGALADWFASSVWQPICDFATAAWDTIGSIIAAAWDFLCGIWGAAAGWFEGTVWAPISAAVDSVESAITGAFQTAYSTVTGLWSGIAGWFESNVIAPIRNKFNSLSEFGSSIISRGAQLTGLSPKANGGFVTQPTQALIGEAGPEVVIPLSSSKRNRAADLMQKAWGVIGDGALPDGDVFDDSAEASSKGFADSMGIDTSVEASTPVRGDAGPSEGHPVSVQMGGVNITFSINSADADNVVQAIRENLKDLTDEVAGRLSEVLGSISENQAAQALG